MKTKLTIHVLLAPDGTYYAAGGREDGKVHSLKDCNYLWDCMEQYNEGEIRHVIVECEAELPKPVVIPKEAVTFGEVSNGEIFGHLKWLFDKYPLMKRITISPEGGICAASTTANTEWVFYAETDIKNIINLHGVKFDKPFLLRRDDV